MGGAVLKGNLTDRLTSTSKARGWRKEEVYLWVFPCVDYTLHKSRATYYSPLIASI